jgi:DNA-binding IclR family transcriptional regulator
MDDLFGSRVRTDVLVAIARLRDSYISEISRVLDLQPTEVRRAVSSLERAGAVGSRLVGRARIVQLEPRYWGAGELYALLLRLSELPRLRERWVSVRRRPRAIGKPL